MYRRKQIPHYPGQRQSKRAVDSWVAISPSWPNLTGFGRRRRASSRGWLNPFSTGNPFLGTTSLGFSIGRGSGALRGLTEGARLAPSLRFADGQKLVHVRKCMELKLFLPGSPGGSKKKEKINYRHLFLQAASVRYTRYAYGLRTASRSSFRSNKSRGADIHPGAKSRTTTERISAATNFTD